MVPQPDPDLASAAIDLVKLLGGTWRGGSAMCRCPAHDDRTPSLSVRIGDTSLLLKCFAGCDVTEVLRAIRRLALTFPAVPTVLATQPGERLETNNPMAARAMRIWEGGAAIRGTPGERYFQSRGVLIETPSLRFSSHTPLGRGHHVRYRDAILAPIHEGPRLVAIQRIFLDRASNSLATDLDKPRLMLGRPMAGAVQLAVPRQVLGLAEGVETALSAMILLGLPVWAALGSERLPRIRIPSSVERLILLPDADRAGRAGARRAAAAYAQPGRAVEIQMPWFGLNDWNDVLRSEVPWHTPM